MIEMLTGLLGGKVALILGAIGTLFGGFLWFSKKRADAEKEEAIEDLKVQVDKALQAEHREKKTVEAVRELEKESQKPIPEPDYDKADDFKDSKY